MSPKRPEILGLIWDDTNWEHILEHILPDSVDELIEGGNWITMRNTTGQPPERVKLVGKTESGLFVTVILQPPAGPYDGFWYPVTAWKSSEYERKHFGTKKEGTR